MPSKNCRLKVLAARWLQLSLTLLQGELFNKTSKGAGLKQWRIAAVLAPLRCTL